MKAGKIKRWSFADQRRLLKSPRPQVRSKRWQTNRPQTGFRSQNGGQIEDRVEGEEMKRAKRQRWTEDDVRRLKLLADRNVSANSIAKSLERSVASVKIKAHWLGLSLAQRSKVKVNEAPA